jgi:hypothetical protein
MSIFLGVMGKGLGQNILKMGTNWSFCGLFEKHTLGPLNGNAIKSIGYNELGKCSCVIDYLKIFDNVCKDYPIERPRCQLPGTRALEWERYKIKS